MADALCGRQRAGTCLHASRGWKRRVLGACRCRSLLANVSFLSAQRGRSAAGLISQWWVELRSRLFHFHARHGGWRACVLLDITWGAAAGGGGGRERKRTRGRTPHSGQLGLARNTNNTNCESSQLAEHSPVRHSTACVSACHCLPPSRTLSGRSPGAVNEWSRLFAMDAAGPATLGPKIGDAASLWNFTPSPGARRSTVNAAPFGTFIVLRF